MSCMSQYVSNGATLPPNIMPARQVAYLRMGFLNGRFLADFHD